MDLPHCFVLDDSDIIRRYTRLIFESLGYRVSEAASPAIAFERLTSDPADMVLVDWRIPGEDPHKFIQLIRKAPLTKRPYIVYVTSENDFADVHIAQRLGADDHMLKPFNRELIEMKLREIRAAA